MQKLLNEWNMPRNMLQNRIWYRWRKIGLANSNTIMSISNVINYIQNLTKYIGI